MRASFKSFLTLTLASLSLAAPVLEERLEKRLEERAVEQGWEIHDLEAFQSSANSAYWGYIEFTLVDKSPGLELSISCSQVFKPGESITGGPYACNPSAEAQSVRFEYYPDRFKVQRSYQDCEVGGFVTSFGEAALATETEVQPDWNVAWQDLVEVPATSIISYACL
ncbi:hypothetical protein W97_01702 [Coniosporium apollinis CBS 100218]|uniref:AA1-like domain-containing protein n=1 Tax=Coniosporium apollinis (strain CBS 100218) TaxID=1168221 RepID=R7YKQ5_CONA1|nr:uncharacterized protein W97_01702 [Coniosporium apollinis CBS 100218]EON62480.1 hypothetical protein W97_01702 [Coniosporium apollinis CBS 100218]